LQHGQKTWTAVTQRKPGGAGTKDERGREGRGEWGCEADAGDDKDEKADADAEEDEKEDALDDDDDKEAAAAEGMKERAECDAAAASVQTAAGAPPCTPAKATPSPATRPASGTNDPEPPTTDSGRKTTTRRSVRARATSSSSARGTLVHAPKPS